MDIFCRIINGELSVHKIYEDDVSLAFLDTAPSSSGHTLVIHKKHGNNIQEYDALDLQQLMETVKTVSLKIEKALNPDSITIGINHKEKKGVPHLHIHLIPRWENDGGHALQGVVNNKPQEELQELARKINGDLGK